MHIPNAASPLVDGVVNFQGERQSQKSFGNYQRHCVFIGLYIGIVCLLGYISALCVYWPIAINPVLLDSGAVKLQGLLFLYLTDSINQKLCYSSHMPWLDCPASNATPCVIFNLAKQGYCNHFVCLCVCVSVCVCVSCVCVCLCVFPCVRVEVIHGTL